MLVLWERGTMPLQKGLARLDKVRDLVGFGAFGDRIASKGSCPFGQGET